MNLKDCFQFYCACPDQQPYFNKIIEEGIQIFELPCRKFNILTFFKLLKWIKMNRITIVHSHGRGAGIYARLLKLFNRKLKVLHNFHGIHIRAYSFSLVVERRLKVLTDKFVFVSKSEQEIAVENGLANRSQSVLIENGIAINNNKCSEKTELKEHDLFGKSIPNNSFVIGMLSRFDRVKNIPFAIRTLSDYLKNHSDVFLVIGGDGEERRKIEQTVEQYNLQHKVILLGFVHDIQFFFTLINVFLNVSLGEAFGLSTVEAMKYGKPVVASNVYGNIDVVRDNETGLLFPLSQPPLLVERINTLKTDRKIYEYLSENARTSVEKRFDQKRMLSETRALYYSFAH
ncbi:MAG: glycosyltransferase [Candidatus Scalindua sp.]|nr:glycosyltransferase [Candidatus Scalindua sp.]MCR4345450.1 glycosyltransferase [Candidatus Scalindua sp.]